MKLRNVSCKLFVLSLFAMQIIPLSSFALEEDGPIPYQVRVIETLLEGRNSPLADEVNSNDGNDTFLKSGTYFSEDEKESLNFQMDVSGTTSPTIVLEPSPEFCGAKTQNPLQKNSFLFECKNTLDECEGYSISAPERRFTLKRVSAVRFLFKSADRIYLLKKSAGIGWSGVASRASNQNRPEVLCEMIKREETSHFKRQCGACGGIVSQMTFEYQEHTWIESPESLFYKYNCEVKTKADCPY